MTPPSRIVIVTGLRLTELQKNVHGVYQRLRILVEAAASAASDVTILSIHQQAAETSRDLLAEEELRNSWGMTACVLSSPSRFPRSRSWLIEQLAGALDYRWAYSFRGINSDTSRSLLQEQLKRGAQAVVAHRLPFMEFVGPLVSDTPIIFDLDDIEHIALRRAASQEPSLRQRLVGFLTIPAVKRAEARSMARAQFTLVCSEHDKRLLDESLASQGSKVVVLPNTTAIRDRQQIPRDPVLLFVGVLSWHPNTEALNYFVENCWPSILERRPDARLLIVGKNPESLLWHSNPPIGVRFLGFVPDIAEIYAKARVVICPIQSGGGTRVKLVEAAAFGKPIVSTTIGAEGLAFRHGFEALLADTAPDFVESCIQVLGDDQLAEALSEASHAHAVARFSQTSAKELLARLMQPADGPKPPLRHKSNP